MKRLASVLAAAALAAVATSARSQIDARALDASWRAGAPDCAAAPQPPLEVRSIGPGVFILRENPCATFEAPFMYLLIGKSRALLIDTGDVGDPARMPLATTVLGLLPRSGDGSRLPLLVVHTHRHMDHRAGDPQFEHRPGVQVVGYDLASVKAYYGFAHWPQGLARVDLGGRIVDVIPTPGHNLTHVAFYDEETGLLFSGDFLMPGRLLIDDAAADRASAARLAAFVGDRPVSAVLGGHIELNAAGKTFPWESRYHPDERSLPMTKADVLALPAALRRFNGFYTRSGGFIMMDTGRLLIAALALIGAAVVVLTVLLALFIRQTLKTSRRRAQASKAV